jgi:HEAT repeat protein
VAVDLPERELLAQMVAMAMRFRSMASNVCDATGLPRRVVKPRALALLRTSCFVNVRSRNPGRRVAPAALVPALDDPETQSIVPWSLAQIGDRSAIPPLIAALDNDDPSSRVLVIYALEELHAKGSGSASHDAGER